MHYGSYVSSINGNATILTKDGKELVPWTKKKSLSQLDIVAINNYYGCSKRGENIMYSQAIYTQQQLGSLSLKSINFEIITSILKSSNSVQNWK